jgi:hypothetical protein
MQEKKTGLGEDSDPILHISDLMTVIGVFDGMGGAGSAECKSDFGDAHTKAYVGSRIVRDAVEKFFKGISEVDENFSLRLQKAIQERYKAELAKYPSSSKGGLRSTLIKEYPTTLAVACIHKVDSHYVIDSYWAGDSRNYIWDKNGLFQITIDDLRGNLDPLQNLHEDAPVSNCIQADGPFTINHCRIDNYKLTDKFVVLSATDGCFGYYQSPMDFERVLVSTLKASASDVDWKNNLTKQFSKVTADDFSYSLTAFGCDNFNELKNEFKSNSAIQSYISKSKNYEKEVANLKRQQDKVKSLQSDIIKDINELWPRYKEQYLKYMTIK